MSDANIVKSYKILSERERLAKKSMFAGSLTFEERNEIIYDINTGEFSEERVTYIPAMLQMFLELFSNCADHYERTKNSSQKVTEISFYMHNTDKYEFILYNNGVGIPIEIHPDYNKYIPQMIFTETGCGQNMERESIESISGGTNGLGLKIVGVHCSEITFATGYNGKTYKQTLRDSIKVIGEPIITISDSRSVREGLLIAGKIDPKTFQEQIKTETFNQHFEKFVKLIHCRFLMYFYWFNGNVTLKLNNAVQSPLISKQLSYIENMALKLSKQDGKIIAIPSLSVYNKQYSWRIAAKVNKSKNKRERDISIIDGLLVFSGGHFDNFRTFIRNTIGLIIFPQIAQFTQVVFKDTMIDDYYTLYMCCEVINPTFSDQSKTSLLMSSKQFNIAIDVKDIPQTFIADLATNLLESIKSSVLAKTLNEIKPSTDRQKISYEKYIPANRLGTMDSTLIITEGDSATGFFNQGLKRVPELHGNMNIGIFSLQGVIPNPRKTECVEQITMDDGRVVIMPKSKVKRINIKTCVANLMENKTSTVSGRGRKSANQKDAEDKLKKRIENTKKVKSIVLEELRKVINLTYCLCYSSEKELATLKYRKIVVATDRDQDGVGNILGLVINWFQRYWPSIIEQNVIKVLLIPIIRCVPKTLKDKSLYIEEFGSQREYNAWVSTQSKDQLAKYTVSYSKGLGSDNVKFIDMIFKSLSRYIYTYICDPDIESMYEVYYGRETKDRKRVLLANVDPLTQEEEELYQNKKWHYKSHLRFDVLPYQQYNWLRKLPGIDGCILSRRKIICGMLDLPNKLEKVDTFIGRITESTKYVHGPSGLTGAFIYMGQSFIGARTVPLIVAAGNFGTRRGTVKGLGKDHANSRYLEAKRNDAIMDTMFPKKDNDILTYNFFGQKRIEPVFYVPVICYAALQTEIIPAHGWRQVRWARDFNKLYELTKFAINKTLNHQNDKLSNLTLNDIEGHSLPLDLKQFGNCTLRSIKGTIYCVGCYNMSQKIHGSQAYAIINITEIPPGISVEAYYHKLKVKFETKYKDYEITIQRGCGVKRDAATNEAVSLDVDINVVLPRNKLIDLMKLLETKNIAEPKVKEVVESDDEEESESEGDSDDDEDDEEGENDNVLESNPEPTCEEYNTLNSKEIDFCEKFLELYIRVSHELNFVVPKNIIDNTEQEDHQYTINTFQSYKSLFVWWFNIRFVFYIMRYKRELILLKYRVDYYLNLMRFIKCVMNNEIDLRNESEEDLKCKLFAMEFKQIIKQLVSKTNPAPYMREPQIAELIKTEIGNYDYLLDLSYRKTTKKYLSQIEDEYRKDTEELVLMENRNLYIFNTWNAELDAVKKGYDRGVATNWIYELGENMDELIMRTASRK